MMTSYGGITRIRLKGRSSSTSSQPAHTSSPVLFSTSIGFQKKFVNDFLIRILPQAAESLTLRAQGGILEMRLAGANRRKLTFKEQYVLQGEGF